MTCVFFLLKINTRTNIYYKHTNKYKISIYFVQTLATVEARREGAIKLGDSLSSSSPEITYFMPLHVLNNLQKN